MRKLMAFVLLAFLALSMSKTVLADVVPSVPPATHEDVIVVLDDDLLQQQQDK